ncbi:MAG: barstar family protein [Armatimonadota bacterium]
MEPAAFSQTNFVHSADLDALRSTLVARGFTLLELDGRQVRDKHSFLLQVRSDFPSPEGLEPHNWDAFSDCLWLSLRELGAANVAVVWTQVERMLDGGLPDLLTAVSCLEQVAISVAGTEEGFPRATALLIFLVGEGPNFPRLSR